MPQIFYMIRHGETDWNIQRRLQGHSDIALNANGELQARSLQDRFQIQVSQVVSSDLIRAQQTAKFVFPEHQNLILTPALREVHLGDAEGLTRDVLMNQYGLEFWDKWSSHSPLEHHLKFSGGESKKEMFERVFGVLKDFLLKQAPDTKPIAFVSHGLVMRSLVHALQPDLQETRFIPNCGVLELCFDQNQFQFLRAIDPPAEIKEQQ